LNAEQAPGIYFVANPVDPDLMARAANRLKAAGVKSALTSDGDVVCRRWLLVDLDPRRPSGISSTDDELRAAIEVRNQIGAWIKQQYGVSGVAAGSGNGAHLMLRVADLPNDQQHTQLFRAALAGLAAKFDTDTVTVDQTVFNASRIWKLYGTAARKGDHIPSRPHRLSQLHKTWLSKTLEDVPILPIAALNEIAALAPEDATAKNAGDDMPGAEISRPGASPEAALGPLNVGDYLNRYDVPFTIKEQQGKALYRLEQCLFNPAHGRNEAAIVQDATGRLTYQCFHQSCLGRTWAEARQLISGTAKIAEFCAGYDPKKKRRKKNPLKPTEHQARHVVDLPAPARLPPIEQLDRTMFLNEKGRVQQPLVVEFMKGRLEPVLNDDHQFYRYNGSGFWGAYENSEIKQDINRCLGPYASSNQVNAITELLKYTVYCHPSNFKHDPRYLNVQNGMIDVFTLEVLPHDKKYLSKIQLPVKYNPDAECPRWHQFLAEVFVDDLQKALALQSFYGYCLLPDCRYQRCLFMIGDGANGKSVAMELLPKVLGESNVSSLPLQLMSQRFLVGQIKDKLVNLAGEVPSGQLIDTENFKIAVAGGMMMADEKHGRPYSFYPIAKHIFAMNEPPKLNDKSYGFSRRPIVLTFRQRFEPGTPKCDPVLSSKLEEELEGIFAWMVEGLQGILVNKGLYIPDVVARDTYDFVYSTNHVVMFAEECCVLGPDYQVRTKQLYEKYVRWCEESRLRAYGKIRFYQQVPTLHPTIVREKKERVRDEYFFNIGLISEF